MRPRTRTHAGPIDRILAVSDLHLRSAWLTWLVDRAAEFDLVILAGDTLDTGLGLPPDRARRAIVELVAALGDRTTVAIGSGNHDLDGRDFHGGRFATWIADVRTLDAATDGDLLLTADVAVSVCPWWNDLRAANDLREMLASHEAAIGSRRWIWVHHAPAGGSPTAWDGRRDRGDRLLPSLIDAHRPDLVVSGHVHEAPTTSDGRWWDRRGATLLANAGQGFGPVPNHLTIDLQEETVMWIGSGADGSPLDAASIDAALRTPVG